VKVTVHIEDRHGDDANIVEELGDDGVTRGLPDQETLREVQTHCRADPL
jgi:hypothetical protein